MADGQIRDEDWDNRKAFPDCTDWYEGMRARSEIFRESHNVQVDFRYGERPRNRLDYIAGDPAKPTVYHIHGGYWQWNDKEDYICVADGALQLGLNFAMAEHTLAPEAGMDEIVQEVRAGLAWLRENLGELGVSNKDIIVTGHSSGGHLASMCQGESGVAGTVLISGLFDLRPITGIYVNDVVGMSEETAINNSPQLAPQLYRGFTVVAFGENELPSFCGQSGDYHAVLQEAGNDTTLLPVPKRHHFDVLDDLMEPDGIICKSLAGQLKIT